MASRKGFQIVGAVEIDRHKVGLDLGQVIGLDKKLRVRVTNVASNIARKFLLEWVAVKVYYIAASPTRCRTSSTSSRLGIAPPLVAGLCPSEGYRPHPGCFADTECIARSPAQCRTPTVAYECHIHHLLRRTP